MIHCQLVGSLLFGRDLLLRRRSVFTPIFINFSFFFDILYLFLANFLLSKLVNSGCVVEICIEFSEFRNNILHNLLLCQNLIKENLLTIVVIKFGVFYSLQLSLDIIDTLFMQNAQFVSLTLQRQLRI